MLHDNAILLANDISGRGLGGMKPSVEVGWLVEDKEILLLNQISQGIKRKNINRAIIFLKTTKVFQ